MLRRRNSTCVFSVCSAYSLPCLCYHIVLPCWSLIYHSSHVIFIFGLFKVSSKPPAICMYFCSGLSTPLLVIRLHNYRSTITYVCVCYTMHAHTDNCMCKYLYYLHVVRMYFQNLILCIKVQNITNLMIIITMEYD